MNVSPMATARWLSTQSRTSYGGSGPGNASTPKGSRSPTEKRRHPHPLALVVRRRREHRRAEALRKAAGVTLVPWVRQNDDRLAVDCEVEDRRRRGGRIR
jgi:hypothetical protein